MTKTIYGVAAAAMMILALTGCTASHASAEHSVTAKRSVPTSRATPSPTPADAAAPSLTATTPTAEDQFYTATIRIPGLETVARAAALKVGYYVCNQLDAGVSPVSITAVQNTEKQNNEDMITVSSLTLCPAQGPAVAAAFTAEAKAAAGVKP